MNAPLQIRPRPPYQRSKPVRDAEYRRFIKRLPCAACLKTWWIDPCHTGAHSMDSKSDDYSCIPFCRTCHEAYDANPRQFAERHQLDIPALIRRFNEFYQTLGGKAA
jgi:hypothetical protein